jgi:flagella basal body P-ring formation protein FlgA
LKLFLYLILLVLNLHAGGAQEAKIRAALQNSFQKHYPSMQIHAITLKPSTSLIKRLTDYSVTHVAITKDNLRRSKGNVMVTFEKGKKRRKLYYKYSIDADIALYTAAVDIQRDRALTPEVAEQKSIPFTTLYHKPIDENDFYRYVAKQRIKSGAILSQNLLKKRTDIQRNDRVRAIIRDGALALSFEAKALQSGNAGDIIRIQKDYKKRFKARILSNTEVEVIQ